MGPPASLGIYIKMNGGRRPNQGRGTANQNKPGRGKHPHLSRRGTIQIIMINIIHIPTGRSVLTPPVYRTACHGHVSLYVTANTGKPAGREK